MPVNVPDKLPAITILKDENIFCMTESQAIHQDIRPLKIIMLNLMPLKVDTEIHFLRLLSNSPLQVQVQLLKTDSYTSKNTPEEHLEVFYKTFDEIRSEKFDGMIITGAPVEHMDFEEVIYWNELKEIMEWTLHNVQNTLHICWAAQAALYHHFGIPKYPLQEKMFGAFPHTLADPHIPLVRGFDDVFNAPHSRHTEIRAEDISKVPDLFVVSESREAGVYIAMNRNGRQIFVTGHSEYDPNTLKREYDRDVAKGMEIAVPKYYYPGDDPTKEPLVTWRSHANLLFSNWLNYYVYQETPYNLEEIS